MIDMKIECDVIGKVVATSCDLETIKEGVLDISRIKPVLHL